MSDTQYVTTISSEALPVLESGESPSNSHTDICDNNDQAETSTSSIEDKLKSDKAEQVNIN